MIFPNTTFAGQKVSICNRYIELFRQEVSGHSLGIEARAKIAELNALLPEAYHSHKLVWLAKKWDDVLNGNEKLGFPGVPLDNRLIATEKKDEAYQVLRAFYKYQREEHDPTVAMLLSERHKAIKECEDDEEHDPTPSDFIIANGKVVLDVPSKNPRNEATNTAFAIRALKLNIATTEEQRDAIFEAISEARLQTKEDDFWDKKINKELVRTNLNLPEPPDPLVDYTLDTEIDGGGDLIVATNTITVTTMDRNVDDYVYRDYGAGYFVDFEHLVDAQVDDVAAGGSGYNAVHMLANAVNDSAGLETVDDDHHIKLWVLNNSRTYTGVSLREWYSGSLYQDSNLTLGNLNTPFYYKFTYVSSTKSLTCVAYSDINRTIPVDTLNITLQAAVTWRYRYSTASRNSGSGPALWSGWVKNTDLQEVSGTPILRRRREGY